MNEAERYCRACGEPVAPDGELCRACGVATDTVEIGAETVYCRDCGEEIRAAAEICPRCGVRQRPRLSSADGAGTGTLADDLERFVRENRGLARRSHRFSSPDSVSC